MPTAGWLRRQDLPLDAQGRSYIDAPSLDQILDQYVNWRGDVNAGGYKLVGLSASYPGNIEVGYGIPGNRAAWIDLIGDDTYTDYGLRIIRNAEGPNASSELIHRGTGALALRTTESGPIEFYIGATKILGLSTAGLTFSDGSVQASAGVPATRQIIAGTGLTGGGTLAADRTLSVVADSTSQRVNAGVNGAAIGSRWWLNFIAGANVVLSAVDDPGGNRVNITINSTGGGTGGSQTPWLSNIDANNFILSNLGILHFGTAPPAAPWDTSSRIWFEPLFGTRYDGYMHRFDCGSSRTEAMRINTLGHVGIGTAGPDSLLTLANPLSRIGNVVGDQVRMFKVIVHDNASYDSNLQLRGLRHTAGIDWSGFGLRLQHAVQTTYMSYVEFNAAGAASGCAIGYGAAEFMRISWDGKVGIGTTAPSNILTVNETQADPQDGSVLPSSSTWRRGLMVQGGGAPWDGACIQMGAASGLGWAIKQRCLSGNEGFLSFYGISNSTANMHEIMRLTGGNGTAGGLTTIFGSGVHLLGGTQGGYLYLGEDISGFTKYGMVQWIPSVGLGISCGGSISIIVRTNGRIQFQGIGSTPGALGDIYRDSNGFLKQT